MRNILNKTRPKDKNEMVQDLKEVFGNFDSDATIERALEKVDNLCKK